MEQLWSLKGLLFVLQALRGVSPNSPLMQNLIKSLGVPLAVEKMSYLAVSKNSVLSIGYE